MKNNFCVIDVETTGLNARPEAFVFGCVYGHNFKKHFFDRKEMINYLFHQKQFKYIFAHNAEYDFTTLFDNIILYLDNSAVFVGSLFIKANCKGKVFLNSLAILKSSVSELGKCYGVEKLILNDKFKNSKPGDKIEVTDEDIEYCYRDCEIIYHYLTLVFGYTGKIKPTIASCAIDIFMSNFNNRIFHSNEYNEMFRKSYYGGRVECFKFGNFKNIYKYDVNSLYPFVCTYMHFPDFNKLKPGRDKNVNFFLKNILPNYDGCVDVEVKQAESFIGVLPFRKETEIIFPCGEFTQRYNFNELRAALKTGLIEIQKIYRYWYAPSFYYSELSDYMKYFFDRKNTTEGAEKMINKFFLNALTGKFGQKRYGRKMYFENIKEAVFLLKNDSIEKRYITFSPEREDLFIEFFDTNQKLPRWSLPGISSYITSEARAYMLPFYLKHEKDMLYTDTDSLIMTCPLSPGFIGDKLGQFKQEKDTQVEILGNKYYHSYIEGKKYSFIKGVSKEYNQPEDNIFIFKKMIRTKESIRTRMAAGSFVETRKELSGGYTKRKVLKNGKTKTVIL